MAEESDQDKQNLRKSKRFNVNWPTRVLLPDKRILPARTRDISTGGVGFELSEGVNVGSQLSVELGPWINGRQYLVRARCQITYSMIMSGSSGFSMGVKFVDIPEEYLNNLKAAIKTLE